MANTAALNIKLFSQYYKHVIQLRAHGVRLNTYMSFDDKS